MLPAEVLVYVKTEAFGFGNPTLMTLHNHIISKFHITVGVYVDSSYNKREMLNELKLFEILLAFQTDGLNQSFICIFCKCDS